MTTSAEPGRRKAYGCDLRWRIVYQRLARGLSYEQIAKNLNVCTSTAYRIHKLFEHTGEVKRVYQQQNHRKKLDIHAELYVVGLVLESPALYLGEACHELLEVFGIEVCPSTICRLLRSYGFTRKKIRQVASQRCAILWGAFIAHCHLLNVDMFVWVDETGSDARNCARKYGYALRGTTPVSHRFLCRGQRTNATAAISSSGLIALELTTSSVNRDVFYDFVRGSDPTDDALQWEQPLLNCCHGQPFSPPCHWGYQPLSAGWNFGPVSPSIQPRPQPHWGSFQFCQSLRS